MKPSLTLQFFIGKLYYTRISFPPVALTHWILKRCWLESSGQTLFFNHRKLDLTLSDLSKSKSTVSPDKLMGQLGAASSSVFEAQSLTYSKKSLGIVWIICPREVPWVIRLFLGAVPLGKVWLPLGKCDCPWDFPRANFYRQPLWTFHCLYQILISSYDKTKGMEFFGIVFGP